MSRWYAVLRGSPHARMIRSIDVGSGWLARKRSTRSVCVAAGTWPMVLLAAGCGGTSPSRNQLSVAGRGRRERLPTTGQSRIRDGSRLPLCRSMPAQELHGAMTVQVDVGPMSIADVVEVARGGAPVALTPDAVAAIEQARGVVERLAAATDPAYGISTGFGALATRHIPAEMREQLQRSLVRSHAAGSGPEVEREVVRALMLLRLSTLATGHTGIRRETAELMAALLSAGITPVVREYGSLGCSGDLAPLSHCALALMGEGEVRDADGTLMPAADALAAAGLTPVELKAKEGLALINGTDGMLGMLVLAITDLRMLLRTARHRRGDERRGADGHRPGLRGRAAGAQPPGGTRPLGRQPPRRARRLGRDGQPPGGHVPPGAGRLLAALLPAGARRRPRHRRARRRHRRA